MKKLATWITAFVFVLAFALPQGAAFAKSDAVTLYVDGVEVGGYEQAFMSNGQALLPIENLFHEAGFKVFKDPLGTVNVTNTYLTVDFKASASTIEVNGEKAKTEFPLTLQNAGNYVSAEFLTTLEGFDVEVSEDQKTVNVTTNRVEDVAAFLAKTAEADLNSFSTSMILDQQMESPLETGVINTLVDIQMDFIQNPLSVYTLSKLSMDIDGVAETEVSESYITKDGFFSKMGDTWVKFEDELTASLLNAPAQGDPFAQIELLQNFTTGIHIFEYDDVYVMTQTLTNDEFGEMMESAMSLVADLLPGLLGLPESETTDMIEISTEIPTDTEVENITADIEILEDAAPIDAIILEELTKEEVTEEEQVEFEGIEDIFEELAINIEEYYLVMTFDKKTLVPLSTSGVTHLTIGTEDDSVSIKQNITGTYSNFNAVKEIIVPADVVKNAINIDDYFNSLFELELEETQ